MMISIEWQKMNKVKRGLMMLLIGEVKVKVKVDWEERCQSVFLIILNSEEKIKLETKKNESKR